MIRLHFWGRKLSVLSLAVGTILVAASPALAGAAGQQQTPANALDSFLALLANPNVAYLLLVLGLLGIVAEAVTPGAGFPGVAGVLCLLLSFYGLLRLPTNWIGLGLIVAGIVMFLVDIKVAGWALSIGALVAFALGSLLIFTPFWIEPSGAAPVARLNPWLIVGATGGVGAFFFLGLAAAVKAQFRPVAVGTETLVGQTGVVKQDLAPQGIVHVRGEEWSAVSAIGATLPAGTPIRVLSVDGLTLRVQAEGQGTEGMQGTQGM